jgi:putative Mg2+ transporter-C (MgtC) family protein
MLLAQIATLDASIHTWASNLGAPFESVVRLLIAAIAGGLVGLEREVRGRQAGFRTNMLVCVGSALVMIVSTQFAAVNWPPHPGINITVDPARIAYSVMTGVGFLGAGTIIHQHASIRGLTTGAAMWCVAAIGLASGFGLYTLAVLATVLVLIVLWLMDYIEDVLPRQRYRTLVLRTRYEVGCIAAAVERCRQAGMTVINANFDRSPDLQMVDIRLSIVFMKPEQYLALEQQIESDPKYSVIAVHDA